MASKHRRVAAYPPADYGPALIRTEHGDLRAWGGAADVVVSTRPDGDHPTLNVVGARRSDGLLDLYARNGLSRAQLDVAIRFRDDCALAAGARIHGDNGGVRSAFDAAAYGPAEAQLDAQKRVRGARDAIGDVAKNVVLWVVERSCSVGRYDTAMGQREGRGAQTLRDALDRLMRFYDRMPPRNNA